jgi:hypothetical protein
MRLHGAMRPAKEATPGGASWPERCRRCIPWRMGLGSSESDGAWRWPP